MLFKNGPPSFKCCPKEAGFSRAASIPRTLFGQNLQYSFFNNAIIINLILFKIGPPRFKFSLKAAGFSKAASTQTTLFG